MKRMLINATQEEELRMAMVDGQRLYDLNIEGPASERKKANIYKGKITRVEPSLEAAFVDYGADRHGFLPLKEISSEYFVKQVDSGKPNIREVLKEGQDIVVQIDKEERGNKGAALTTFVSLAGRFIVLKPNKDRSGGVSRRIVGDDRDLARKSLNDVDIPNGMSVILRTAGIDRSSEELEWDLETLLRVWQAILDHVLNKPAPFLLYREDNSVIRALRDYLTNDIGEILIDDEATYSQAMEFVEQVMPHNAKKIKLYNDTVPLFTRFQIESQIESAFAHNVNLPSGGSIVIDHTEALVSIDINSARATKGGDIEATALNTNLEAAEEIARQLRIRDLGGLIVIDFIDMGPQKNQREVENRLRDSVKQDRARVQIGKISRFGLLEMSRQRLRPSIGESAYQTCPRCTGFGTIRSIESLALAILRIIGEEARKERTAKVIAQLPVEVATYLLNEKRDWVQSLETINDTHVVLVANSHLETPHYDIRRVRDDQTEMPENTGVSYSLAQVETLAEVPQSMEERNVAEQAAIDVIKPASPPPQPQKPAKPKKTNAIWAWLTGLFSNDGKAEKTKSQPRRRSGSQNQSRGRNSNTRGRKRNDQRTKTGNKKRSKKKSPQSRDRKPSRDQAASDQTAQKKTPARSAQAAEGGSDEQKRPSRNRRSRGGRRRRRSAEKTAENADTGNNDTADQKSQEGNTKDAAQQQSDTKAREQKPRRARRPKAQTDGKTPDKAADSKVADSKAADSGGPPRARTDSERQADSASPKVQQSGATADAKSGNGAAPASEAKPAPAAEKKPAENSPTPQAEKKVEPQVAKPAPAPAPTPAEKPAATAKKPAPKKAESRLLPWDAPATPVEKPTKPATGGGDSADQG